MAAESQLSKAQTANLGVVKARRAQGTPGSEAYTAAVIAGSQQLTATCTGFEVMTAVPRLGRTSQKLKACHISVSGD